MKLKFMKRRKAHWRRSKKKRKKDCKCIAKCIYIAQRNTKTFFYQLVRFIKYFRTNENFMKNTISCYLLWLFYYFVCGCWIVNWTDTVWLLDCLSIWELAGIIDDGNRKTIRLNHLELEVLLFGIAWIVLMIFQYSSV